ncbi:zinc uptake transcriptional repressor Zur [secondary endosymbiont of Ctenarytaina eucalypti]|uniref:Fe2+/Zn2+ uptake regulation protein n=1 Tax=secondary endosymbiont of Ctenarytaina eucalypti TaxID=1199245 RepID=J3YS51_9ENTR|nr:zinc uptake transcriptional repressor Zur [secondary endosymbiont of Ctenarytaina eucalypti]AFP84963.1 Fe2+/Zn2+ uptake regulation protein [secondary endosymbiont of Ctenarytaina eucalypti]
MKGTIENLLLRQAEQLCEERNVRFTPQRQELLRLMQRQNGAISAYHLLDLLRQSEPQAKPPTVYRALDFLLEQGFVHRVESTNSFVLCDYFSEPSHTSAFFICDGCSLVTEQTTQSIEDILQCMASVANFIISHNVVEAHGLCPKCAEVQACEDPNKCEHDHSIVIKKR